MMTEGPSGKTLNARSVLATIQPQFVARIDFLVARWLKRRAISAEAAQRWIRTRYRKGRIPKPIIAFGLLALASLILAGCADDQDSEATQPERPAPTIKV